LAANEGPDVARCCFFGTFSGKGREPPSAALPAVERIEVGP
jgi:hypothetical protein